MRLFSLFVGLLVFLGCSTASAGPKNQDPDPLEQLLSQMHKDLKPASVDGTLELFGEINQDSVEALTAKMDALKAAGAKRIVIRINSFGGNVGAGFVLTQKIETIGLPVICIGDTLVESMAFYTLQSCTERWATKRTTFMAHPPADYGINGNAEQLEQEAKELTVMSHSFAEHEAARLKISLKQFEAKIAHHAWYFNWDEAVKIGAIDKVVAPSEIPPDIDWN